METATADKIMANTRLMYKVGAGALVRAVAAAAFEIAVDPDGDLNSNNGGDQHEGGQFFVHVARGSVLSGAHQRFSKFMGDVAGHGDDAVHAQIHHAGRHEEGASAADKPAQDAADKAQQHHLQRRGQTDVDEISRN